jgi:asparagine synthase (glutamine-hydrolysing)
MCGIFAFFSKHGGLPDCHTYANKIKNRGPEQYSYKIIEDKMFLGFQRLKIMDVENGNQPFYKNSTYLICNGEIYNYKELIKKYSLNVESGSDCEVILHMYLKFGIEKTLEELDGVFAFIIYDQLRNEVVAARDSYGVRPLFISLGNNIVLSSELKGLYDCKDVMVFPAGSYFQSGTFHKFRYYDYQEKVYKFADGSSFDSYAHKSNDLTYSDIKKMIRFHLTKAVEKRMQSERKIGCLLSGGLDSSLVTALVNKMSKDRIITYSVGLEGSVDLKMARKVANFLGTEHHEIIFSEEHGLQKIPEVIYATETWDTTTIRASVPMYIMSEYISKNTPDVKVIMSGEGSDEICQGYLYFHQQPNHKEGHKESVRLLKDLLYFDVLRSDRTTAAHGLEVRVPFLDRDFVNFYMSIPELYRAPGPKGEKWLLRESFAPEKLLPEEILWRTKDGLSDGCSSLNRPWYQVIQEKAELEVKECTHETKEDTMYRQLFNKMFPGRENLIPYKWMPRWVGKMTNPSGRLMEAFA